MADPNSEPRFRVLFNAKTASHSETISHAKETNRPPYTLNRGLKSRKEDEELVRGYNETLPTFRRLDLQQWILVFEEAGIRPVRILDIGYGVGQFMLDAVQEYDFVECTGLGSEEFSKIAFPGKEPTYEKLETNPGIHLIEGDLPFRRNQIADGSQNIVLANNVFLYLDKDLQKQVISGIYSTLAIGGVALINQVSLVPEEIREIVKTLGSNVDFEESSGDPDIGNCLSFSK